jgi:hypothetical protein
VKGIQDGLSWITDDDGNKIEQCYPLVTFFFAKLPVMNSSGIRVYYIVVSVCCSLYFCGMLAVAVVQRTLMLAKTGKWTAAELGGYQTGLTEKQYVLSLFIECSADAVTDSSMFSLSVDGEI